MNLFLFNYSLFIYLIKALLTLNHDLIQLQAFFAAATTVVPAFFAASANPVITLVTPVTRLENNVFIPAHNPSPNLITNATHAASNPSYLYVSTALLYAT